MSHSSASEKLSIKSLKSAQKMKCMCFRTLQAFIGTITIFTTNSGSSLVYFTDSTTGQRMPFWTCHIVTSYSLLLSPSLLSA